jgi:hypothetical protein
MSVLPRFSEGEYRFQAIVRRFTACCTKFAVQNEATIIMHMNSFQWKDAYEGDLHQTVLIRQSDLTPDKPGTDISFLGMPGRYRRN